MKSMLSYVGRNDGKKMPTGQKQKRFKTQKQAETWLAKVLYKRDFSGVSRGDYYID